jgi:hypothetical protein
MMRLRMMMNSTIWMTHRTAWRLIKMEKMVVFRSAQRGFIRQVAASLCRWSLGEVEGDPKVRSCCLLLEEMRQVEGPSARAISSGLEGSKCEGQYMQGHHELEIHMGGSGEVGSGKLVEKCLGDRSSDRLSPDKDCQKRVVEPVLPRVECVPPSTTDLCETGRGMIHQKSQLGRGQCVIAQGCQDQSETKMLSVFDDWH